MSKYVGLEAPTVLGMGAVGPTLALFTATLCSAFGGFFPGSSWMYPVVMLLLSGAMAVFPAARSAYPGLLKAALWPVMTAVIFASAWTSSSGLSIGEEKLRGVPVVVSSPADGAAPLGMPLEPGTDVALSLAPEYNGEGGKVVGRFFKRMR